MIGKKFYIALNGARCSHPWTWSTERSAHALSLAPCITTLKEETQKSYRTFEADVRSSSGWVAVGVKET
ncbi:unnamed protein product, partial [Allacma fusca]